MREEEGVLGDVPNTALGPRRLLMQALLIGHVIHWPLLPNRSAFWAVAMAPAEHHHIPQTSWPIEVPVRDEQKSLGFQKSPLKEPDSVRHTLFPFHLSYFLHPGTRCDGWNCSGRIVIMRES